MSNDAATILARQRKRAMLPGGGRRQTCKACGEPHKFCYQVPDDVWRAVVPEHLRCSVVCLHCFDDFAYEKGVRYASRVTDVCFAGDAGTLVFKTERSGDRC